LVRETALQAVDDNFNEAKMLEGQSNYDIRKRIIQELLKMKIHRSDDLAEEILRTNVFSLNPADHTIAFQSRLIEVFVMENLHILSEKK
jgi:hypothetical protein